MEPFLFVTDLHGDRWKYQETLVLARKRGIRLIVNGGDISPHGRAHEDQRRFLREFLDPYLEECQAEGIRYLLITGNDDLRAHDALLDKICRRYPLAADLSGRRVSVGAYDFIGMNLVTDFPFRLKDRARRDSAGSPLDRRFTAGLFSTPKGWEEIPDWPARASILPTIEEELSALPRPRDPCRAVYVLHGPPSGLGLDVVRGGEAVGSAATRRFIEREQPLLTLHGHIHESPEESGAWMDRIGRTVCIQPGQSTADLTAVVGRLEGMTFERLVLPRDEDA